MKLDRETEIKLYAPLLEDWLKTDLGQFVMRLIQEVIDEETSAGDYIGDIAHASQRHYDKAAGARKVKQAIEYQLIALQHISSDKDGS